MANPLIRSPSGPKGVAYANQSKGILDDYAVRKDIQTRSQTVSENINFLDGAKLNFESSEGTATDEYTIKLKWADNESKPKIMWSDENDNPKVWLVAHDYLSYPTNQHQHFSIETTDASGELRTRLEFPYGTDTTDIETHDSNFIVGGTGNFEVADGDSTLNGNLTIQDGVVLIDSTGTATLRLDRAGTSNYASQVFTTAGSDKWSLQMRNDSTNKLYLRDNVNSSNAIVINPGSTPEITASKIVCNDIQLNAPTQNVTSSRYVDTVYQNNSNYTIWVHVSLLFFYPDIYETLYVDAVTGPTSSPTTLVSAVGVAASTIKADDLAVDLGNYWNLSFMVPPNYYYKLNLYDSAGWGANVISWFETKLGAAF